MYYMYNVLKSTLLLTLVSTLFLIGASPSLSQITVTVGGATTFFNDAGVHTPFTAHNHNFNQLVAAGRVQLFYTAAELTTAGLTPGLITSVAFRTNTTSGNPSWLDGTGGGADLPYAYYVRFRTTTVPATSWTNFDAGTTAPSMGAYNPLANFVGAYRTNGGHFINAAGTQNNVVGGPGNGWQKYDFGQTGVSGGFANTATLTTDVQNGVQWNGTENLIVDIYTRTNLNTGFGGFFTVSIGTSQSNLSFAGVRGNNNGWQANGTLPDANGVLLTSNTSSTSRAVMQLTYRPLGLEDIFPDDVTGKNTLSNEGLALLNEAPVYDDAGAWSLANQEPAPYFSFRAQQNTQFFFKYRIEAVNVTGEAVGPDPNGGPALPAMTPGTIVYTTSSPGSLNDTNMMWARTTPAFGTGTQVFLIQMTDVILNSALYTRSTNFPVIDAGPINATSPNFGTGQGFEKGDPSIADGSLVLRSAANTGLPPAFSSNIPKGTYRAVAMLRIPSQSSVSYASKQFFIRYSKDLAALRINQPKQPILPDNVTYPRGVGLPVQATFANVAKENAGMFRARLQVYWDRDTVGAPSANITNDSLIWADTATWRKQLNGTGAQIINGLASGDSVDFDFNSIPGTRLTNVGDYYIRVFVELQDSCQFGNGVPICNPTVPGFGTLIDQQNFNDSLPRAPQADYIFRIQPNNEVQAVVIQRPTGTIVVRRPTQVRTLFRNNGKSSAEFSPVRVHAINASTGVLEFNNTTTVDIPPTPPYNERVAVFPGLWQPQNVGTYNIKVFSEAATDEQRNNDTAYTTVTVLPALSGTYTIGLTNVGHPTLGPRNYASLKAALDDLYFRGIDSDVRFEFTDDNRTSLPANDPYLVGEQNQLAISGLDLRSRIISRTPNDKILFTVSAARAQVRGSVVVRMRAANGIGLHFGQSVSPANPNAVQLEFPQPVNKFANSNGNITFEGGPNKSLRLELQASTDIVQNAGFRAAVYFDRGSVNNAVRNCLISTTSPSYKDSLPLPLQYTPSGGTRTYPDDFNRRLVAANNVAVTYSAGILNRNVLPYADSSGSNPDNLDTIINANNQIVGNVINGGFGYGVVSLGIDYEQQNGNWTRMYNRNTLIQDNWISGCFTGGIYVGNEENCQIIGNRIDSIRRPTVLNAGANFYTTTFGAPNWNNLSPSFDRGTFGIQAGGDSLYSNINLRIVGNEVSNIVSSRMATGILVEQARQVYGGSTVFPTAPMRTYVANNMVWGIGTGPAANGASVTTNVGAPRVGIMLTTRRRFRSLGGNLNTDLGTATVTANYFNPQTGNQGASFFTERDTIINNTVVIGNDQSINGGTVVTNGGVTAALGVQNALAPVIWNNALSVVDNNVDINNSTVHAALFLQGITSRDTVRGARTDYNAYFTPFNAATVRFIRTDLNSGLFDGTPVASTNTEFQVLRQWRAWVGRDLNSVNGDFVSNHEIIPGTAIAPRRQRVKTNPLPLNSVLNNRGVSVSSVGSDIDMSARGNGGQAYDIGANEFNGASLPTDVEVVEITSPVSYKAEVGAFSDAEHVMTTFPITFTAIVRNAGNQNLTNVPVNLKVRVETSTSNNTVTSASVVTPIGSMFPARSFSSSTEIDQTVNVPSLLAGESRLVVFSTPNWVPSTYGDTNSSMRPYTTPNKYTNGGTVAARMSTMFHNVTPRYQVVVTTPSDDNPANNLAQKEVRFYRIQAGMQVIASVTGMGAATPVGNPARLNADSLITNMDTLGLGWRIDTARTRPVRRDYDVFDRGSWEQRAVNYRPYRTMFWAHGGNATLNSNIPDGINTAGASPLNRFERDDLRDYFNNGTQVDKKQFIVASQEIVPGNARRGAAFDKEFVEDYLRADTMRLYYPAVAGTFGPSSNPTPRPGDGYNNRQFLGRSLNFGLIDTIAPTGVVGDPITVVHPAIMRPFTGPNSTGLATTASRYTELPIIAPPTLATLRDSIMGIALATPTYNAITIGVDWRHIRKSGVGPGFRAESGIVRILRGAIDFFDRNGGWVVPVELVDFEATGLSRSVDVRWATAQEVNSGYFEVERATLENGLRTNFEKIANVSAAGNSQTRKDYGIIDNNVSNGVTYVYRLRIVDKDGSFDYSGEQIVSFGAGGSNWIGEVSPNPVQSIANFDVHIASDEATEVTLFDMSGRKVATLLSVSKAGVHNVRIDAMNLPSGMYTVSMTTSKETITRQIQVVK